MLWFQWPRIHKQSFLCSFSIDLLPIHHPPAVGAGAGDRGAVAAGSLSKHDPGSQPPGHGAQCTLCRGGVPGGVTPAPQQGVPGGKQASQRCPAQRSGAIGWKAPRVATKLLRVVQRTKSNTNVCVGEADLRRGTQTDSEKAGKIVRQIIRGG